MSSAEQIGRSPNSHLAAAGRRPLPDLYDLVQGRENPAVICRCQKTGIGGKSGDHRTIYKACDVAITPKKLHHSKKKGRPASTPAVLATQRKPSNSSTSWKKTSTEEHMEMTPSTPNGRTFVMLCTPLPLTPMERKSRRVPTGMRLIGRKWNL